MLALVSISYADSGVKAFAPAAAFKINFYVQKLFETETVAPVFILLKQEADLSRAAQYPSKTEKATYLYETLVAHANATQGNIVSILKQKNLNFVRYFISNAILVQKADRATIEQIALLPEVKKIVGNPSVPFSVPLNLGVESKVSLFSEMAAPSGAGPNIASTGADRAWLEFNVRGQSIVVAGQDTGVEWNHPALKNQYRGWNGTAVNHDYNWHDAVHFQINPELKSPCGYENLTPCDDDRHGTHTMGTMVGSDGGPNQIGMAPKARWISCKNMDKGFGNPATYLECFQFFLAPTPINGDPFTMGRPDLAPDVINNSWGCNKDEGCDGDEMLPALKVMKAAGIMVVVSAGNDGPGCATIKEPPAMNVDWVLSVGAHDQRTGKIASFSSRGPSAGNGKPGPDVTAPGVKIRSSVPGGKYEDDGASPWSGTSMAGPHVAGLIALMWSANPKLIGKIDQTIDLIHKTALGTVSLQSCGGLKGDSRPNNVFGYGRIRSYEAVQAAMKMNR